MSSNNSIKRGGVLHGLLLIDKPRGYTSHDIVRLARKALGERKIGHCGTLDPEATGLLILTVGRGTRLTRFLIRAPKVYTGEVTLGVTTDTYDAVGDVVATSPVTGITVARVKEVMHSFEGTYLQTPPPYCAKKINGKKFYELARRGEETPTEKKPVQVYGFETTLDQDDEAVLGQSLGTEVPFELRCASGTYARSLAHHLGEELGCGAHLSKLRRTLIGTFSLDTACTLDQLEDAESVEALGEAWIDFDDIPLPFPDVEADLRQEKRIRHGQTMLVPGLDGVEGDWVKVTNSRRQFIAVGTVVESHGDGGVGVIQPKIVFQS